MDITKLKLPYLRKCCFCVPLSTGVLIWGIINLIYHAFLLALLAIALLPKFLFGNGELILPLEIMSLLPVVWFFIGLYSLIIVISGHSNNVKQLRAMFIGGTVLWIFVVLYSPYLVSRMTSYYSKGDIRPADFVLCLILVIIEPFLQGYVLLLLRSMMLKLQEEGHSVEYTNFDRNEVETGDEGYFPNETYQPLFKK